MASLGGHRRLAQVEATGLLDTPREPVYDSLTRLAAAALHAPGALLTVVDEHRQWFKSTYGLAEPWHSRRETPLSHSFCRHVVERHAPLVVADARLDPMLRDNPAIEELGVVAYLGVPLVDDGHVIGTVAVFSPAPRSWSSADVALLTEFARLARTEIQSGVEARRRARDAAQHEAILSHIPSAVVSCDAATGRVVHWNALAVELWGERPASLDAWAERHHDGRLRELDGDLVRRTDQPLRRAARGIATPRRDYLLRATDGGERVIRATALPVVGHDGERLGAVMIADDVTEEVHAVRRLREEKERLRALHASSPVGIFESDTAGNVTHANPRLLQIWGASDAEVMGLGWTTRVHPDDLPELMTSWRAALAAEREYEHEYRLAMPNGDVRWVHGRSAPLHDAQGHAIGSVGTIEDVTARRHGDEQLRQVQRLDALGRLAGGIAHDFNNLLTAIRANAEALLDAPADARSHEDAQQIVEASTRAAELTRQLLAFSRRQVLKPRVVDPNRVVRDVDRMLRRLIPGDVTIAEALAGELPRIVVDPGQLEQVLVNLAINARDAMPDGGTITFSTTHDPTTDRVELAVADTGVGMDDPTLRRAFEPFFTTKPPERGTGLGLAMAHGVVVQSGGTIAIESAPGRGTRVVMSFPATVEEVRPIAPRADDAAVDAPTLAGEGRVLLVEDEPHVRASVRRLIAKFGYDVVDVSDATTAIARWAEASRAGAPFRAVVTDLVMPGIDGAEMARQMRADDPALPIVLVTGYTDRPPPASLRGGAAAPAGRTVILQKPFTGVEIASALADVLTAGGAASR